MIHIDEVATEMGRMVGTCKPSGYAEYDGLTGYVTRAYTTEWTDRDGTRWRKMVTIINLGRPDRGIPVDPDAQMEAEKLVYENQADNIARMARLERTARRRKYRSANEALCKQVQAYLAENGPMSASEMARRLPCNRQTLLIILRANTDLFYYHGGLSRYWGLVGVAYVKPYRPHNKVGLVMMRDCLLEHGPLAAVDIERFTKRSRGTINHNLVENPGWFVVVGIRPGEKQMPPTRIWGVAGVHEPVKEQTL